MSEAVWDEVECLAFAVRALPGLRATGARAMAGGFWNDVLRLDTDQGPLVVKHYRAVMPGTLFPNLPADEAKALQRLAGLSVAPEPVGFWGEERVLVYRYVAGTPWDGDVAAVARLIRRKRVADVAGFRSVPMTAEGVLAEGAALFAVCRVDDRVADLLALRPVARDAGTVLPVLVHTDIGAMNLIGAGDDLRLIDWQCPAAGDEAEDVASFLSPAFQLLNMRAPMTVAERAAFFAALDDPVIEARLRVMEPVYAWRMAAYCCRRIETAPEAEVRECYAQAADSERERLREWWG
ncbi:MAG: phosphotransferase [Rhodobacterales bacterium]|nr:phosphotransferase [Rhodobacterales bacterium]